MLQTTPFTSATYVNRRQTLMQTLGSGQILLIGNREQSKNFKDNVYPFRQDSTFLYYIGVNLPHLYALIDIDNNKVTLYGDDATIDTIIWTGPQNKLADLAQNVGIDKIMPTSAIHHLSTQSLHYLPPYRSSAELLLQNLLDTKALTPSIPLIQAVVAQRNIKSQDEITKMNRAVTLSNKMHRAVKEGIHAGQSEYDLVSIASQVAWENQVKWAYEPILTIHGETLHNHHYHNKLKKDDMVLYDGGIELASGYCGDITRTFPVSGQFTSLQQDLYNITVSAYNQAVSMIAPGVKFLDLHLAACKKLVEGLTALGWMKGNAEEAVAAGAHTLFFQCGLGHMIGLDVHDMENLGEHYVGYGVGQKKSTVFGLKSLRLGRALEVGYCVTIEPGIYVIPALIDKFKSEGLYQDFINYEILNKHRDFGGIRVEDDYVVTEDGYRKLGDDLTM